MYCILRALIKWNHSYKNNLPNFAFHCFKMYSSKCKTAFQCKVASYCGVFPKIKKKKKTQNFSMNDVIRACKAQNTVLTALDFHDEILTEPLR